jgi:hypothetical protein
VKYLLSIVAVSFGLASANPYMITWVNEFSTDPAHQWVELHARPYDIPVDSLNGAVLTTSISACTLNIAWDTSDYYVVVDSQSLANGNVGNGTFRLRPDSDFIRLSGSFDDVVYPCDSTGFNQSLAPPPGGSSSCWNFDCSGGQYLNWYIDSTPTPGASNDDYSTISGSLESESGYVVIGQCLSVTGRYGCAVLNDWAGQFAVAGLGAGRYSVRACGYHNGQMVYAALPESVEVGYAETLSGINLVFRPNAVTESRPAFGRLTVGGGRQSATVVQGVLWLPQASSLKPRASSRLMDIAGRRVLDLEPGANDVSRLAPGVYFVWSATTPSLPAMSETLHSTYKVVVMR